MNHHLKLIKIRFFLLFLFLSITPILNAQEFGIKTNLAYWATTTPNIGIEYALNRKYTLELNAGFNPFTFDKENTKIQHWTILPELRYWLCESYNGHFIGLHALAMEYNTGGKDLPTFGRLNVLNDYRFEGVGFGGGISYGYQWVLTRRMNFELNVGAGYINLDYDKYPCMKCGSKLESANNNYIGVTKAAVSLIYLLK